MPRAFPTCHLGTAITQILKQTIHAMNSSTWTLCRQSPRLTRGFISVITLRASEAAAQCIVIGPVCVWVFVCGWVCHHYNSKLCALIITKLSLYIKLATISSWLNFVCPAPPGRGLQWGEFFGSALLQPAHGVCVSSEHFCHFSSQSRGIWQVHTTTSKQQMLKQHNKQ